MGEEDFTYFLQKRPGRFLRLGTGDGKLGSESLHSSRYLPASRVLLSGAAAHVAAVTLLPGSAGGRAKGEGTGPEGILATSPRDGGRAPRVAR